MGQFPIIRHTRHNTFLRGWLVNLSDSNTASGLKPLVEHDGFAIVPACLDEATVERLCKQFDDTRYPQRNLLSVPSVQGLAMSRPVREIMDQNALRLEGFFSTRLEAQTGRSFGTKI
jgi:hypothetical protein